MNSNSINLYDYYSNFANFHIFNLIDVGDFEAWMCKIEPFFYFPFSNANVLE